MIVGSSVKWDCQRVLKAVIFRAEYMPSAIIFMVRF